MVMTIMGTKQQLRFGDSSSRGSLLFNPPKKVQFLFQPAYISLGWLHYSVVSSSTVLKKFKVIQISGFLFQISIQLDTGYIASICSFDLRRRRRRVPRRIQPPPAYRGTEGSRSPTVHRSTVVLNTMYIVHTVVQRQY